MEFFTTTTTTTLLMQRLTRALLLSSLCTSALSSAPAANSNAADGSWLPVVDLGYVQQQASWYNASIDYYVFKNIRYAAPPINDLRFRLPEPPLPEPGIVDGNKYSYNDSACHQFLGPGFFGIIPGVPEEGLEMGSEDCLFVDVWVPGNVIANPEQKVPVLGWWHPGGYAIGSKDFFIYGAPGGLLNTASDPLIFVAANYRLGAFGWLAPTNGDISANLGFRDVRASMDWISKYISLFGGDSSRFTAMGDSAGAASIAHVLTAFGGKGSPPPFNQAIIQSPAWTVEGPSRAGRDNLYNLFLDSANCSDIACLRSSSTSALKGANKIIDDAANFVAAGIDIGAGFAPLVDDDYVPDYIQNLMAQGRFHKIDSIIASNTREEGAYFVVNGTAFQDVLENTYPNSSDTTIKELLELFPSDGTSDGEFNRAVDFQSAQLTACNSRWLADGYSSKPSSSSSKPSSSSSASTCSQSFKYIFHLTRDSHGNDMIATFGTTGSATEIAQQQGITNYVLKGPAGNMWVEYGATHEATWLNTTGLGTAFDPWGVGDPAADARCGFFAARRQFN